MRKRDNPAYSSWYNMKDRCNNPNNIKYHIYGGKGITYDKKWETFEGFLSDMGPRPVGTSIDRINSDFGYNKLNCRWADSYVQATNVRRMYTGTITDHSKYRFRTKNFCAEIRVSGIIRKKFFATKVEARSWLDNIIEKEKLNE